MTKQKLPSSSLPLGANQFNGGLNSTASPLDLQPNESSSLLNIDFDKFGAILKRPGYVNINTVALDGQVSGIHWLEKSDATKTLMVTAGAKAYSNDLSSTFTDQTNSMTITAGNLFKCETFLDTAMFTNGVDAPIQSTGTTFTAMAVPTGLTKAKWIKTFNAYTFLANVTDGTGVQPSKLYWSDINSITGWTSTSQAFISKNDGQGITGLEVLGDHLVIFKDRSIWLGFFTGDADIPFQFQKTQSHVGCASGYSIQKTENSLIFFSDDGVYLFDGNNSYKISDRVTATIQGYNQTKNQLMVSMYQKTKNRYYLSSFSSASTTANGVLTYDNYNNAFSLYNGWIPSQMCMVYTGGQERPYFGDYSGYIYRADTGVDDYPGKTQTAINAYFYTYWISYNDLVNQKGIPQVDIYFRQANATVTFAYSYDFEESDTYSLTFSTATGSSVYGVAVYGTGTYSGTGGAHVRKDLTGRGKVVRFGFKNSTLSETMRIDGIGQLVYAETNT